MKCFLLKLACHRIQPIVAPRLLLICMLGVFIAVTAPAGQPDSNIQSEDLGPRPADPKSIAISPDGRHIALAVMSGSRYVVRLDGKAGPKYDEILGLSGSDAGGPKLSGSANLCVGYVSRSGEGNCALFSPDGQRVAYVARKSDSQIVVLDGQEGAEYEQIKFLAFTPDSGSFLYLAKPPNQPWQLIVDDREGPTFARPDQPHLQFSPTGHRWAYVAAKEKGSALVVDGNEGPIYRGIDSVFFSENGSHVAYRAMKDQTVVMVLDGDEGREYADISNPVLSPDGKRLAYLAVTVDVKKLAEGSTGAVPKVLIVDGQEVEQKKGRVIKSFGFSTDGRRAACSRWMGGSRAAVVVDGKVGLEFERVSDLRFSPDSERLAYLGYKGSLTFVVVGDDESSGYNKVDSFRFSPQGDRYVFAGWISKSGGATSAQPGWRVVVDGKEGPVRNSVLNNSLTFSPDGRHVAYAANKSMQESCVVLDDQEIPFSVTGFTGRQSTKALSQLQFSPDGKHLAFVGKKADGTGEPTVIVDGRAGPSFEGFAFPTFSADSKHFGCAGWNGAKYVVIVDGKPGAEYDDVFEGHPSSWEFRQDGTLRCLAANDRAIYRVAQSSTSGSVSKTAVSAPAAPPKETASRAGAQPQDEQAPTASTDGTTTKTSMVTQVQAVIDKIQHPSTNLQTTLDGIVNIFQKPADGTTQTGKCAVVSGIESLLKKPKAHPKAEETATAPQVPQSQPRVLNPSNT